MAQAPGYRRQVGVSGPAALPQASAADFGAGVGAGIERLGSVMHESEVRAYQIERRLQADQQRADFTKRFAETQGRLGVIRAQARANPGPGAVGHQKAMEAAFDEAFEGLTDGIAEDSLRRDAAAQIASARAGFVTDAVEFEVARSAAKQVTDTAVFGDQLEANVATGAVKPGAAGQQWDDYLDGLYNIDDDTREKLRRQGHAGQSIAANGRLREINPDAALAAIDAGAYNDVLDGRQIEALRARAEAEKHSREAAERAQRQLAIATQKEGLATSKALLDTGAGTPADWEKLAQGYDAVGDTSSAVTARAKGGEMAAVQGSRDWTPVQMQQGIAALQAEQAGKGGLTPAKAVQLAGLKSQLAQSQARLGRTGGALEQYQYATSKPLPPIDLNNPTSMQQRATYAIAAAQKYGQASIQPLLESELPGLRQLMEGGPADKQRVLETIGGFGNPAVVEGAARQVAGGSDEGGFRIAATRILTPGGRQVARDILRGGEALKANPSLYNHKEAAQAFAAYGPALQGLGPDFAADTLVAARNLYASRMAAQGLTGWSPGEFRNAIDAALGGYHEGRDYKGGSWTFKNQRVIIPTGWTADGVFRRIARMSGAEAASAQVNGDGRWPDGSLLYTGQLREMIPVFMGGTRYGFRDARSGRLLPSANGGPYQLDVARVPLK